MERDWLYNVITLESGWNPAAYNPSGAVGLIQFMPQTLKGMGLLSPYVAGLVPSFGPVPENVKAIVKEEFLAKFPNADAQLQGPVLQYFKKYTSYPTEQSVYMAVFYPKFRDVDPSTPFPAYVQAANPGIDTVQDYLDHVNRRVTTAKLLKTGIPLLAAFAAATAYFFMRA